jgi:hypothetical protein
VKKDFGKDEADTHIISEYLSEPSICAVVHGLVTLVYYWLLVWFILGYWFILGLFSLFNVH